jgi:hypothetical protein
MKVEFACPAVTNVELLARERPTRSDGLPRARRDQLDGLLVGSGDHPPAGEQRLPARGGQGEQVLDDVVAGSARRRG